MLLLILLGIFTAFLSLAFALLHLMASLSELRKHKNTLEIGFSLSEATLRPSLILYFLLPIVALFLWLIGVSLICYGAY